MHRALHHLCGSAVSYGVSLAPTGNGSVSLEGSGSVVAANGDELFFAYAGGGTLVPGGSHHGVRWLGCSVPATRQRER